MKVVPMTGGQWMSNPFTNRPVAVLSAKLTAGTYTQQISNNGLDWTDAGTVNVTADMTWSQTFELSDAGVAMRIVTK